MSESNAETDEQFGRLLARRSAWRWGLTGVLVSAYFCYAIGSLYAPEHYASSFPGTSVPSGILVGFFLIVLSVATSLWYVRVIHRLTQREFQSERDV